MFDGPFKEETHWKQVSCWPQFKPTWVMVQNIVYQSDNDPVVSALIV
jgi:hypothetical protein